MIKKLVFILFLAAFVPVSAQAQRASLDKAKYIAVLKVITDHKMGDKDLASDFDDLRENERFKKSLDKMLAKLNNERPNEATNLKVKRILEQAGKDIYNLLK